MKITPYNQPSRPKPWGAKWRDEGGKRRFKFFGTEKERDDHIRDLTKKVKKEGEAVLQLSSTEAGTMKACLDILGDPSAVLLACREYAGKEKVIEITPGEAIKAYQQEKRDMGRDENYQRAKRAHLERLETFMPDRLGGWVTEDARRWVMLLTAEFSPVTVKNHVRTAITFCRWCLERQYLSAEPFSGIELPDIVRPEPEIVSVDCMEAFIRTASAYYQDAVAYIALNAFGGLRSSVCARLSVDSIRFEERGILIPASAAKNKRRIYVDGHPDNLWEWLLWAKENAPEGFDLSKRMWDRRRGQIAKKAGVTLPHNGFRHSFCSYHVAMNGDAGKTATLLTHRGNVSILYEHYRGNATKVQGEAYFSIVPESN